MHFQTPLYYLGKLGWHAVGNPMDSYRDYRRGIEQRAERDIDHILAIYDVLLKFILESEAKRIIGSESGIWQEQIDFGNIPDAWIQFNKDAAFIEVDLDTEGGRVLRRKFDNYTRFNESGGFHNRFPGFPFKVLVITTTEARIEFMEQLGVSNDIWFCTMEEFLREKLDHEHWFALNGFYALPPAKQKEV